MTLSSPLVARQLAPDHAPHPVDALLRTQPGPWPLHDSAASRVLDALAATHLPPHTLMQRAGRSVARLAMALAPHATRIHILAGSGNNGGDGYEAAVHLRRAGRDVTVHAFGGGTAWPPDAAASRRDAQLSGVRIVEGLDTAALADAELLVDALLGRGLTRPASGDIAEAIRLTRGHAAPVLAVDLPSGLPGDTGALEIGAPCVQARWTLALLSLAPGLFTARGRDQCGQIWWDALGVSLTHVDAPAPAAWLHGPAWLDTLWPRRCHADHKGSFGDVWIRGGAPSMGGAALLAGRAALGAGAGRAYVASLDPAGPHVDTLHPELMFHDAPAPERLAGATVVAGCGGGEAIRAVLPETIAQAARLVLDADALNALAGDATLAAQLQARHADGRPSVLTPHPLEAARLLGCSAAEVQSDRLRAARALAAQTGAVIVLKGSGTVVASPGAVPWINTSGNAGLATPGSGDVLAGWLAGLWSQLAGGRAAGAAAPARAEAELAARHAVHLHGRRAERLSPDAAPCLASRLVPGQGDD